MPPFKRTAAPRGPARAHRGSSPRTDRVLPRGVLALAFALGAGLATVGFAPARWLAGPLAQATGGHLQLVNVRGTWWQGQADVLLTGGHGSQDRAPLPGGLHWRLRPSWGAPPAFAAARPVDSSGTAVAETGPGVTLVLNAPCCTPQGLHLRLAPHGLGLALSVPAHTSAWPAPLLSGLGTPWNTLQLQGRLELNTPGVSAHLGRGTAWAQGQATLDVRDAASRLSTLNPMGSYRLHWQGTAPAAAGQPTTPRLSLSTLDGALQLQGQGQWVAGRLRFEGHAEASPGREQALANLLNLLGRRQGARTLIKIG